MTVLPGRSNNGGTSAWQAFISLLKGYVGPGCLSLPWAISQLGIPFGAISVFVVSYWTSMNIWHVVELKRMYQEELEASAATTANNEPHGPSDAAVDSNGDSTTNTTTTTTTTSTTLQLQQQEQQDHNDPETTHDAFGTQPSSIIITYPDVGHWLYGKRFAQFLTSMICVQQLAVCTVFLSFIGENLGAALEQLLGEKLDHTLVITFVLPCALLLTTSLSNLKVLAPVMTLATLALFAGFAVLFVLVFQAWPQRPQPYLTEIQDWGNLPLAICAILFSFEGICLILPIETSMTYGKEQFGLVFCSAMAASALIFASVASFCVMAFGRVSSGSITAFLVQQQQQQQHGEEKEENLQILNMANLLVSLAVLLTYPLQLFPSYELVGPSVAKYFTKGSRTRTSTIIDDETEENGYVAANSDDEGGIDALTDRLSSSVELSPAERPFSDEDDDMEQAAVARRSSEEIPIAATLNLQDATTHPETSYWNYYGTSYGDTPAVRIGLVFITYSFAIVVPNVQLLVSLAGAVSGSATGLLVPPLLQLAHWKKKEQQERQRQLEEEEESSSTPPPPPQHVAYGSWYYQRRRMQCYILFMMGCLVLVIGTVSALWDIIKVYRGVG
ncbi:unnamed protein product [Cylindrotheca closterium]|uniref:Amino acid transporter transmembrane domain-containing protein n=1 Tax=Cylindrotheca closterium TaxID=2856 RepID=A0AAD2FWH7_9STRA|nr:unnamed protein product [Cylindrotheca closterium]